MGRANRKNFINHQLKSQINIHCRYCLKALRADFKGSKDEQITIDHLIPRSKGGTESWDNLAICCYECNQIKGNSDHNEYGQKPKPTFSSKSSN